MSVKKMIELYVHYELDPDTYHMMWMMTCHGLISRDNWMKFTGICYSWQFNDDQMCIIDESGRVIYKRDESGLMCKI